MKKTGIFVALPVKHPKDITRATADCLTRLQQYSGDYYFEVKICAKVNAPFLTSKLAGIFDKEHPEMDWFCLFSADQVMQPEDFGRLLEVASDMVGGLVTMKENAPQKLALMCGNFNPDGSVRYWKRGQEVSDTDVMTGKVYPCDVPCGGAIMVHRRVIESLRPEDNDGLAYWCYDKQVPAYDIRFFQRAKEKGFKGVVHCGVVIDHVGYEGRLDADGFWITDEPKRERAWNYWDCMPVPAEEKEEVLA